MLSFVLLVALALSGCGGSERLTYANELDEPNYREGQALLKSGRRQEALSAFLKVIDKRGEDAPESHLEAGLIYAQSINDPLSAIYHFKKYLSLRPNSTQAPLVKQRIDAAIREFARTLPAQSVANQVQRVDLIAEMDKLKSENELLKQKVAELQSGRPVTAAAGSRPTTGTVTAEEPSEESVSFNVGAQPVVRTPGNAAATPTPVARTPAPTTTAPATTAGARRHTVVKGDTLMSIALRYYGNRSKWRDIYAANRNVMRSESDLKLGAQLVIP